MYTLFMRPFGIYLIYLIDWIAPEPVVVYYSWTTYNVHIHD